MQLYFGGSSESYVYAKSTLVKPFTYIINGQISLVDFSTLTYLLIIPQAEWDLKTSDQYVCSWIAGDSNLFLNRIIRQNSSVVAVDPSRSHRSES